jgi:SAM-dependent methyltransferase
MPVDDPDTVNDPQMWDDRYAEGLTGWDLGAAPPVLLGLIEDELRPAGRLLVPGCGHGHDSLALARAGWEVTGLDFAPRAVAAARASAKTAGVAVTYEQGDLFEMPTAWTGAFDAIWEQTCYCAIHPDRRDEYVAAMARVLASAGRYVGLFMNHQKPDGPPFDVTREDVTLRFGASFDLEEIRAVENSAADRPGEFLLFATRR